MPEPPIPTSLVEALKAEQRERWQKGERVPAEALLERHPTLQGDGEPALEVIYHEVLLREELGEAPQLSEYQQRFPQVAPRLQLLFEVHRVIASAHWLYPSREGRPGGEPSPVAGGGTATTPTVLEHGALSSAGPLPGVPAIPGYEVLGVLGQGGMGMVYRARHVQLNRVVALKIIRTGAHASSEEVSRFRAEAEAVARLQDPNIVQIYELGEHAGCPYLALEFVDGGSLADRLNGKPLSPRQAAELTRALARGVQSAHERGVVHRDLKPANVLLTADGLPKITDFGLAKRLDLEQGRTQPGVVMGTPSYMAPEQAEGRSKEVGPTTDVYALGAILYELLTGRPPFQGTSSLETLQQVQSQEPVPPRLLQPKVPCDLETICLKCLQKAPGRRYPSAAELAGDLQRFLDGEAIRARGYGVLERLARTLDRKHLKIEFRTWGTIFLLYAPIALLTHLVLFALTREGPPYPNTQIGLTVAAEFALMGAVFWAFRSRTFLPLSAIEGQLVSMWTAYLVTAFLLVLVGYQTTAPEQAFDILTIYPVWAVVTGLMFCIMGSTYWGQSYLTGLAFFGLALLMLLHLSWAPLEFGLAWCVYFTLSGLYLRRLGDETRRDEPANSANPR